MLKKKYFLVSFLLLVSFFIFNQITNASGEPFGNVVIGSPMMDSSVRQGSALEAVWNIKNKSISNLPVYKAGKNVLFRFILLEDVDCSNYIDTSCSPQKYTVSKSVSLVKNSDHVYKTSFSDFGSQVLAGRFRLGICYLSSANQKLTKELVRSRCGLSGAFNLESQTQDQSLSQDENQNTYDDDLNNNYDNNDNGNNFDSDQWLNDINNSQDSQLTWEEYCALNPTESSCGGVSDNQNTQTDNNTASNTDSGIFTEPEKPKDTTPPVITLNGVSPVRVRVSSVSFYWDQGFTVDDSTAIKKTIGKVDKSKVGTYILTYTATDPIGNVATATRSVIVFAPEQPLVVDCSVTPEYTFDIYKKAAVVGIIRCQDQSKCMTPSTTTDMCFVESGVQKVSKSACYQGYRVNADNHVCQYGCYDGACNREPVAINLSKGLFLANIWSALRGLLGL